MAIILPDAIWRPFSGKSTTAVRHDILCAHTEVGSNEGSIAWGAQAGNPYAHNYTDCLGVTTQCQDLSYRAAANLEGNPYVLAWETEDMDSRCFAPWGSSCGNVPAWTDAQVRRLILDMAWCCIRFNIPPYLIPDTKAGRRGLAYHRQGVPNSPEWVVGSLRWTSSSGKCCPDWRRIAQFRDLVIPGVQRIVLGTPPVPQEDDMKALIVRVPDGPNAGAIVAIDTFRYRWYVELDDAQVDVDAGVATFGPGRTSPGDLFHHNVIGGEPGRQPEPGTRDLRFPGGLIAPVIEDTETLDAAGNPVFIRRYVGEALKWLKFEVLSHRRAMENSPN